MESRRHSNLLGVMKGMAQGITLAATGLVGCGDPCAASGPHLGTTACIAGVVTDYSAKLGNTIGAGLNSFGHIAALATGPVTATGAFSLTLAEKDVSADALLPPPLPFIPIDPGQSCSAWPTPEPADLLLGWTELNLYAGPVDKSSGLPVVRTSPGDGIGVQLVYSKTDGRFVGKQICNVGSIDWNLDMRRGWNVLLFSGDDRALRVETGAVPAGATWHHRP
ncbi:MAG: hypothetical protein U1A78_40095 [Polyangia bacterium]